MGKRRIDNGPCGGVTRTSGDDDEAGKRLTPLTKTIITGFLRQRMVMAYSHHHRQVRSIPIPKNLSPKNSHLHRQCTVEDDVFGV